MKSLVVQASASTKRFPSNIQVASGSFSGIAGAGGSDDVSATEKGQGQTCSWQGHGQIVS